jgi:uncharacterized protein (DUF697 family)
MAACGPHLSSSDWAGLFFWSMGLGIPWIGGWAAGRGGGRRGLDIGRSLVRAVGFGCLSITAASVLTAAVMALLAVAETVAESEASLPVQEPHPYIAWKDDTPWQGVALDQTAWLMDRPQNHDPWPFWYCDCVHCIWELSPEGRMRDAVARGFSWAFFAPVFCIIGAIPATIAGYIGHALGTAARARDEVIAARDHWRATQTASPAGSEAGDSERS